MIFRFGECRLDIERRQLMCAGHEQPLAPKAFDLLRLLIDARPRVLTKAEIMDLVWPDAFVAEANVAILVGDIRAAIGDPAREATLIRTHHGVGYSFIGAVTEMSRRSTAHDGPAYVLEAGSRTITLAYGASTVGRDAQCDVVLVDPSVSRRHARLVVSALGTTVEDLGSKNGTLVEGKPVDRARAVEDGAEIVFGAVRAVLRVHSPQGRSTLTL